MRFNDSSVCARDKLLVRVAKFLMRAFVLDVVCRLAEMSRADPAGMLVGRSESARSEMLIDVEKMQLGEDVSLGALTMSLSLQRFQNEHLWKHDRGADRRLCFKRAGQKPASTQTSVHGNNEAPRIQVRK
jgi:hypothetical protein